MFLPRTLVYYRLTLDIYFLDTSNVVTPPELYMARAPTP